MSKFKPLDAAVVIDPSSKHFRCTGVVSEVQGDRVSVHSLSRTISALEPGSKDKPVWFREDQLKLRGEPDPPELSGKILTGSRACYRGDRVKVLSVQGDEAKIFNLESLEEDTALVIELQPEVAA